MTKRRKIHSTTAQALKDSVSKVVDHNEFGSIRITQSTKGTSVKFHNLDLTNNQVKSVKRSMASKGYRLVKHEYQIPTRGNKRTTARGEHFIYN